MDDFEERLTQVAAQVYGAIAIASSAHAKPAPVREQSIQICVDDALLVAKKILDGAKARAAIVRGPGGPGALARRENGQHVDDVLGRE